MPSGLDGHSLVSSARREPATYDESQRPSQGLWAQAAAGHRAERDRGAVVSSTAPGAPGMETEASDTAVQKETAGQRGKQAGSQSWAEREREPADRFRPSARRSWRTECRQLGGTTTVSLTRQLSQLCRKTFQSETERLGLCIGSRQRWLSVTRFLSGWSLLQARCWSAQWDRNEPCSRRSGSEPGRSRLSRSRKQQKRQKSNRLLLRQRSLKSQSLQLQPEVQARHPDGEWGRQPEPGSQPAQWHRDAAEAGRQ